MAFAIHRHKSAMGVCVFPILNPPSHLPPHPIPLGYPSAAALSAVFHALNLDCRLFHIWPYTCFNAILSNHPTLAFSHRVQKSVLHIRVSFAVLHIVLWLPSLTPNY